jgi:hypothetical protein
MLVLLRLRLNACNKAAVGIARALLVCSWNRFKVLASLPGSLRGADDVCGRRWTGVMLLKRTEVDGRRCSDDDFASASTSLESLNALLPPSSLAINPCRLTEDAEAAVRGRDSLAMEVEYDKAVLLLGVERDLLLRNMFITCIRSEIVYPVWRTWGAVGGRGFHELNWTPDAILNAAADANPVDASESILAESCLEKPAAIASKANSGKDCSKNAGKRGRLFLCSKVRAR